MIQAERLTKRYGPLLAVDALSFEVAPGEVLGFLGPNGAGKSTTMKMLTGFVAPTSGDAIVCGHRLSSDARAARERLGYLPEGAPSYPEMTVRAFLAFIAAMRGLRGHARRTAVDRAVGQLDLGDVLTQTVDTLSKGYRRRVGLAQAILHDPPVLILDEPTDGLDPNQKHQVRRLIEGMSADKIIIISTHILEEVEAVCSRALIISSGRILADDTPRGLAARARRHNAVTLRPRAAGDAAQIAKAVGALPGVASVERADDATVTAFPAAGAPIIGEIAALAGERGWSLIELHQESGRLDEVFREITGETVS